MPFPFPSRVPARTVTAWKGEPDERRHSQPEMNERRSSFGPRRRSNSRDDSKYRYWPESSLKVNADSSVGVDRGAAMFGRKSSLAPRIADDVSFNGRQYVVVAVGSTNHPAELVALAHE
jgi:hypothetical protein